VAAPSFCAQTFALQACALIRFARSTRPRIGHDLGRRAAGQIDLQPRRICAAGDQAFHDIKQLQEFGLAQTAKLLALTCRCAIERHSALDRQLRREDARRRAIIADRRALPLRFPAHSGARTHNDF